MQGRALAWLARVWWDDWCAWGCWCWCGATPQLGGRASPLAAQAVVLTCSPLSFPLQLRTHVVLGCALLGGMPLGRAWRGSMAWCRRPFRGLEAQGRRLVQEGGGIGERRRWARAWQEGWVAALREALARGALPMACTRPPLGAASLGSRALKCLWWSCWCHCSSSGRCRGRDPCP